MSGLVEQLDDTIVAIAECIQDWTTKPEDIISQEPQMTAAHMAALLHSAESLHVIVQGHGNSIQRQTLLRLLGPHLQVRSEMMKEAALNHEDVEKALPRVLHLQSVFARCKDAMGGDSAGGQSEPDSPWAPPPQLQSCLDKMQLLHSDATKFVETLANALFLAVAKQAKNEIDSLDGVIGKKSEKPVWCRRLGADCDWQTLIDEAEKTLLKPTYTPKIKKSRDSLQKASTEADPESPPPENDLLFSD